jgi:hypothetical protein
MCFIGQYCSSDGGLAQMVERVLSMHEAQGSIPWSSTFYPTPSCPNTVWRMLPLQQKTRQRRDLNPRGRSPLAFKTNSLTTRTRCLHNALLQVKPSVINHDWDSEPEKSLIFLPQVIPLLGGINLIPLIILVAETRMRGQNKMWRSRVSIPVPRACKARALPFELHPQPPARGPVLAAMSHPLPGWLSLGRALVS